jgi:acyl-CoA hydrolase
MLLDARPVSFSQTTLTELMIPSYANFGGKIHGGILLSLMDKIAYVCAAKHAGGYCVTVSVDTVEFREPVEVGDLVSLHARVNYVGRSSMQVGIRVVAENPESGTVKHTNTSYFTMVAKGPEGKPREVPPLLLETPEDLRRFLEAIRRRELRQQWKEAFAEEKSRIHFPQDLERMRQERCVIGFEL